MLNASYTSAWPSSIHAASAMNSRDLSDLSGVIPNLHWRYSGVTATNRMVAPRLAKLIPSTWLGPDAPDGIARLAFGDLLKLRRRAQRTKPRIWHARRNNEMLVGLALKCL